MPDSLFLVTGLSPTVKPQTQGWVAQHHKALSHAYQTAKRLTQQWQEQDQDHYNRRAELAPLLPGEQVLIRNFQEGRRKADPGAISGGNTATRGPPSACPAA